MVSGRTAFVSAHLRAAISQTVALPRCLLREHRRWHGTRDRLDAPAVYYGTDALPQREACASGGVIKCQDLERRFPNACERPNTLYLVSSALPADVAWQVRMARRNGAVVVLNQNGVAYPGWHGAGWQITNRANAYVHATADHVVYQSQFCQQAAERFLPSRRGSASVLRNPVDTAVFKPRDVALPPDPLVLLAAGSYHFASRLRTALHVLALVRATRPDARLLVAGRLCWAGSEEASRREAQEWVTALGLQSCVELCGAYAQVAAPDLIRRAHILVHAVYNDSCPRLVVEAMACGLPAAYSHSGGVPELVGETAGAGVPAPFDWDRQHPPADEAMAQAVLRIASELPRYAAAARARAVTELDVRPWLERHAEIFEALLAGARDARRRTRVR